MPENPRYFNVSEGWYETPTNLIEHPAKIAVVMATFVRKGQIEDVGGRRRNKEHIGKDSEYIRFTENKLDLIKFHLACLEHYDAGIDYELIIVDNSTDDEESAIFLKDYCEKKGIQFIQRPNTGFSFGAYNHIWKLFGKKYDYYLFHEQDIVPCKDGWLKEILLKFMSDRHIGAVGNVLEGYRGKDYFVNWGSFKSELLGEYLRSPNFRQCNLDGAFMFTSSRILEECGLQVIEMKLEAKENYESWNETPGLNELFWQHHILDKGYKLSSFGHNGKPDDVNYLFTNGIQYVDFGILDKLSNSQLAPMIHGQTLYCNKRMRKHFSWYNLKDF